MRDSRSCTAQSMTGKGRQFNFNKLQAVLCMVASAAIGIALVVWLISALA